MEAWTAPRLRPRERIVETARDLFHKHGIRGVGVDSIAEAAGTNKMTLYRHFGSKDDLICQCLRECAVEADGWWSELEAHHPGDPVAQLHAWVAAGAELMFDDDRGCDLANAAVELAETDHPARRVIEEIKTRQRDRLASLCRRAGIQQGRLAGRHVVAVARRRPASAARASASKVHVPNSSGCARPSSRRF